MDKIFLHGLETEAVIGFYDWERKIKQALVIDLEMAADACATAAHDDIQRTLNYEKVGKRVLSFVSGSQCQLVETLAESLAQALLTEFKLPWLKLTIHKPGALRYARDVGVQIERTAKA